MDRVIRQALAGNIFLIICSVFYLGWWILAFRPVRPVTGLMSGWLLLPALVFGACAVYLIIQSFRMAPMRQTIIPAGWIFPCSAGIYVLLAVVTGRFMKRPVTTELILIVAWTAMTMAEINMFYGIGTFSFRAACGFLSATVLSALISMAAYVLYYHLDAVAGYVDGMIPLVLAALMMAAISFKVPWHQG